MELGILFPDNVNCPLRISSVWIRVCFILMKVYTYSLVVSRIALYSTRAILATTSDLKVFIILMFTDKCFIIIKMILRSFETHYIMNERILKYNYNQVIIS